MIYRLLSTNNVTLSSDELKMYAMVFKHHQLEVDEFTKLTGKGEWVTLRKGDKLTCLNKMNDSVWLIVDGDVSVKQNGDLKGEVLLHPGQFVGEVSLLKDFQKKSSTTASATCVCQSETVKCFRWSRDELFDYLESDAAGKKVVETLFADVVDKFHAQISKDADAGSTVTHK